MINIQPNDDHDFAKHGKIHFQHSLSEICHDPATITTVKSAQVLQNTIRMWEEKASVYPSKGTEVTDLRNAFWGGAENVCITTV